LSVAPALDIQIGSGQNLGERGRNGSTPYYKPRSLPIPRDRGKIATTFRFAETVEAGLPNIMRF